jgi:hypothetical protein
VGLQRAPAGGGDIVTWRAEEHSGIDKRFQIDGPHGLVMYVDYDDVHHEQVDLTIREMLGVLNATDPDTWTEFKSQLTPLFEQLWRAREADDAHLCEDLEAEITRAAKWLRENDMLSGEDEANLEDEELS